MRLATSKLLAGSVTIAALLCCAAARADLVTNGGFETGDFTGWTTTGLDSKYDSVYSGTPQAGLYAGTFGNPAGPSKLSQSLSTIAGRTYDISFWLQNEADPMGVATPNSFAFVWGGVTEMALSDAAEFSYKHYDFLLDATAASTELVFEFSQTAAFWDFDSVEAQLQTQAVPEPGSFALAGLAGLLALGVSSRRRTQSLISETIAG